MRLPVCESSIVPHDIGLYSRNVKRILADSRISLADSRIVDCGLPGFLQNGMRSFNQHEEKNMKNSTCLLPGVLTFLLTTTACAGTENNAATTSGQQNGPDSYYYNPDLKGGQSLDLTVDNISPSEGQIRVALFNSAEGYNGAGVAATANLLVNGQTASATFENLPAGQYAIKLYHDVDNNAKMNTNAFGIPTEPYAFSNNATGKFGPAKWEDAVFSLSEEQNSHRISFK